MSACTRSWQIPSSNVNALVGKDVPLSSVMVDDLDELTIRMVLYSPNIWGKICQRKAAFSNMLDEWDKTQNGESIAHHFGWGRRP